VVCQQYNIYATSFVFFFIFSTVIFCLLLPKDDPSSVFAAPPAIRPSGVDLGISMPYSSMIADTEDNKEVKVISDESLLLDNDIKTTIIKESQKREGASTAYKSRSNSMTGVDTIMGVWGPPSNSGYILEQLEGTNQSMAINGIISQGFDEYYFVMSDFRNPRTIESTESLLKAADGHNLKVVIILLPPSEGGPQGNYDWKGWIGYFNSLKERHPNSFEGFTIDDFNWISTKNDTRFENNIDFMEFSDLMQALKDKREDVKFYPTVYFEGKKTDVIVKEFLNYIDGVLAVSACYYNVSALEPQLHIFREIFENKPIKYIVYPTTTYNYSRQGYSPPSDRLVASTLSIASSTVDGLIVWHQIDNPMIQEYLKHVDNEAYISKIERMEELQIKEESEESTINHIRDQNSTETQTNCGDWYIKYTHAYNNLLNSSHSHQDNIWKEEFLNSL
jgi:hypothetical protein